jgi:glycosyltransferase involved in cell wall biosynthesis
MSNILHITEAGGGVIEVIKNIIETDSKNQHQLLIRRRDFSSLGVESSDLEFDIHFWEGHLFKAIRKYKEVHRSKEIDTVHFHSSRAGLLRMFIYGPAKVYSPHCFAFERLDLTPFMRWIYRMAELILLRFTDGLLGVNSFEADWASKNSLTVKTSIYEFVASPGHKIHDTKRIISVGRICRQKNPEKFVQIITSLRKIGLNVDAIWVGDGDWSMRKILEHNGIQVTGWLHKEEVVQHLRNSRILLHTAEWEGMPVVFYEAWSIGLPIIAAKARYLNNVNGVTSFQSIVQAIEIIELELKNESKVQYKVIGKEIAFQKLQDFYNPPISKFRFAANEK